MLDLNLTQLNQEQVAILILVAVVVIPWLFIANAYHEIKTRVK